MTDISMIEPDRQNTVPLRAERRLPGAGSFSLFRFVTIVTISLLVLIVALVWIVVGAGIFGYRIVDTRGNSMVPALQDGDALWETSVVISEIKPGYVVTLGEKDHSITHRVVSSEAIGDGSYLLITKGDANRFTEGWHILPDTKIPVMVGRIPFAGYVLAFISGTPFKFGLSIGASCALLLLRYLKNRRHAEMEILDYPVR